MAKPLGPQMIEMYVDMIKQDFDPLITRLKNRTHGLKPKITKQVKIDLGIYELYQEKAALNVRLDEIKSRLAEFEVTQPEWRDGDGSWRSRIDKEVAERMDAVNEPLTEAITTRGRLIREIKLSGIGEDIKTTFDALPGILKDLAEKFADLPELTNGELLRLGVMSPEALVVEGE